MENIIAWWSGGVTSAVACHIALKIFNDNKVRFVFIDTKNEADDTYRFKTDCEKLYNSEIETISNNEYKDIKEVWYKYKSLNVAHGAICSSELKRVVRIRFQKENPYSYQVFGFDRSEIKRAIAMKLNYSNSNPIFPLLLFCYSKKDCITFLENNNIKVPEAYADLNNNNCLKTGCVQGGIGYWQLIKKIKPDLFNNMANIEHELTNLKGEPVTMLKDQSKNGGKVFLIPHPKYPDIKDITMMKGREPKPLMECNGFCGINDLITPNKTSKELNY